jgi:hypothetical protein
MQHKPVPVLVSAVTDERSSPDHPLGDAVETFVRREDAERFVDEVRSDNRELASYLRIEERELGGLKLSAGDLRPFAIWFAQPYGVR